MRYAGGFDSDSVPADRFHVCVFTNRKDTVDITNKTVLGGETGAQNDKCSEDVSVVLKPSHNSGSGVPWGFPTI